MWLGNSRGCPCIKQNPISTHGLGYVLDLLLPHELVLNCQLVPDSVVDSTGYTDAPWFGEALQPRRHVHAITIDVIAVLPFINMSGDPEQEYFSDGLTNDIITDLSRFGRLSVIAAHSTFAYKGKSVKVQDIAQELRVHYVLEGSIQRAGKRVRINAQLIDATTGQHVWAERYNRETQDLFEIQDEIIETIVATLAHKVDAVEAERGRRKPRHNVDAYDCYLKGREIFFGRTKETNVASRELMEKAIELDPKYARAYGFLAWIHVNDYRYGWSEDPEHSMGLALELALRALALDPSDYESHWRLGFVYLYKGQFDKATVEYEKARALTPDNVD